MSSAPDWLTKPTRPGFAMPGRERRVHAGSIGFMTPRQFGPTTRIPYRRAASSTCALERRALGADLLEPGADDDHALDARPRRSPSTSSGARLRRRDDDREVDGLADRRDRRVGLDAEDRRPGRVDRVDGAAERARQEVPQDRPADAARLLGRADDGDRASGGRSRRAGGGRRRGPRLPRAWTRRGRGGHRDRPRVAGMWGRRTWRVRVQRLPARGRSATGRAGADPRAIRPRTRAAWKGAARPIARHAARLPTRPTGCAPTHRVPPEHA